MASWAEAAEGREATNFRVSSWAQAADEQEKGLLDLADKVRRVDIGGSGDTESAKPGSSWAQAADDQEKGLLDLADKVRRVDIGGSGNTESAKPGESATLKAGDNASVPVRPPPDDDRELLVQKIRRMLLKGTTYGVEVERSDPNSPLHSSNRFEDLPLRSELLRGVLAMGFDVPSKIQEEAVITMLADPPQNLIAQSQNGTGKTAAFLLASLSRVEEEERYPQVLILSPTYELAKQTGEVAERMAQFCPRITFCYAVRGARFQRGEHIQDQVILGTPGKIIDWAFKFEFFDISRIKVFVLDEADNMITEHGHHDQSIRIHKRLSSSCQSMLFSATYDKDVMDFIEMIIPNPIVYRLQKEEECPGNIRQFYVMCDNQDKKFAAISNIYGAMAIGQTIVFCHTRQAAFWLAAMMSDEGHAVAVLTGELTTEQRVAVIDRFRAGQERVLITTNVCARGIDVEQVTLVVNYDLPLDGKGRPDYETYLHRIGRSGRFGKPGMAISLLGGDRDLALLKQIEDHFGRTILKLDATSPDDLEKLQS